MAGALLTASVLAAWAVTRHQPSWQTLAALLPQQAILTVSAYAAVAAVAAAHYGDGVIRPREFILADQKPVILVFVLHTAAVVEMHARRTTAEALQATSPRWTPKRNSYAHGLSSGSSLDRGTFVMAGRGQGDQDSPVASSQSWFLAPVPCPIEELHAVIMPPGMRPSATATAPGWLSTRGCSSALSSTGSGTSRRTLLVLERQLVGRASARVG
jgi:hypothetical protein